MILKGKVGYETKCRQEINNLNSTVDIRQTYNVKYVYIFRTMNKQQRMKAELKVVRSLKYWEDADWFRLETKKKIAEMVVAELEDYFGVERGLQYE